MTLRLARALSNDQDARLLLPLCGRRWPGEAGSDEGSLRRLESLDIVMDPHPTSLREATFSHEWEKESRTKISPSGDHAHA